MPLKTKVLAQEVKKIRLVKMAGYISKEAANSSVLYCGLLK
jgi:hypothetical protein